jgi:Cu2+-exporting ATPase
MGFLEQKTKLNDRSGYCGSGITQHMREHNNHRPHSGHSGHAGHDHSQMVANFRKRFWISLLLTIPVLALSPMIQHLLGLGGGWRFAGDAYVLTVLSSVIYFYGGWPFLDGLRQEVRAGNPGMMTLVGVAITAAYIYSVATVVGLAGDDFFWELVTLIDIMLFGHWIEMKSVIGAGVALEKLAALMPDTGHLLNKDGSTLEVAVNTLKGGEHLLVKPGEKIPPTPSSSKVRPQPMNRC